jgi:thiamine-phosphate pyrophosphorylase
VHAIVEDIHGARRAILAGATVVQLRAKIPTDELVARGLGFRSLRATFIVNDDVEAAIELNADGVHLGQCDPGAEIARQRGLILGRSATTFEEAASTDADYLGVGPIWTTPSKVDAATPGFAPPSPYRSSRLVESTPTTPLRASAPGHPAWP